MTAQKSTAKHNYFMVNFKNRLKDNRKISIIITILHILSVPAVLLNGILYSITQQRYYEAYELLPRREVTTSLSITTLFPQLLILTKLMCL